MEVDESFAGRSARCATCGCDLRVPKAEEATPTAGQPRPGAATVTVHGETVEIVPPLESMVFVSLGIVALSVVAFLVVWLTAMVTLPATIGAALGALLALLGAIMGMPAYTSIHRARGRKRGKELAVAGLLSGVGLFLIFTAIAVVGFVLVLNRPPCEENLKQINLALRSYAQKHDGRFPMSLEVLAKEGYLNPDYLTCPAYKVRMGNQTYAYYVVKPDVSMANPLFQEAKDLMVVSDGTVGGVSEKNAHTDGYVRVLQLDGTVIKVAADKWQSYKESMAKRWNSILNKILNPKPAAEPAAPGGAAPAAPESPPAGPAAPAGGAS
jgi:hypothetical protein